VGDKTAGRLPVGQKVDQRFEAPDEDGLSGGGLSSQVFRHLQIGSEGEIAVVPILVQRLTGFRQWVGGQGVLPVAVQGSQVEQQGQQQQGNSEKDSGAPLSRV